jgi:hypothetical protein
VGQAVSPAKPASAGRALAHLIFLDLTKTSVDLRSSESPPCAY